MQVRDADSLDLLFRGSPLLIPAPVHHSRGKKKVRRRYESLPPRLISSRSLHCSRNVMVSARSAAPVPAPATVYRAFTMRVAALPAAVQKMIPIGALPYQPHTTPKHPVDPVNMTLSPCPHDKPLCPHRLIAQRLQGYCPYQRLRPLTLCRSSAPWTNVNWVIC